jgi:hypothetical protein
MKVAALVPLLRREPRPLRFEVEDRAKAEKPFARRRIFGDGGGLPEPPAALTSSVMWASQSSVGR